MALMPLAALSILQSFDCCRWVLCSAKYKMHLKDLPWLYKGDSGCGIASLTFSATKAHSSVTCKPSRQQRFRHQILAFYHFPNIGRDVCPDYSVDSIRVSG